jgi:hypothetical protein
VEIKMSEKLNIEMTSAKRKKKNGTNINMLIPEEIKGMLLTESKKEERSLSKQIIYILKKHYKMETKE